MEAVRLVLGLLSLAVFGRVGCSQQQLVSGNSRFALDLYNVIRSQEDVCNVVFSPISVSTIMAMVDLGAKGDTKSEIEKIMKFEYPTSGSLEGALHRDFKKLNNAIFGSGKSNNQTTLKLANRLFGRNSDHYSDRFLQDSQLYYNAPLRQTDFVNNPEGARMQINKWVEQRTERKITDLLKKGAVDSSTMLVLVSAIYFKGLWENPFDAELTGRLDFHLDEKNRVLIETMSGQFKTKHSSSSTLNSQLLELEYAGRNLSMFILLPNSKDGLLEVEKKLHLDKLNDWITKRLVRKTVKLTLPKFKLELPLQLKDILLDMGIKKAFVPGSADLSGMKTDGKRDMFLSRIDHKVFIQVDEDGTEAAATTGSGVSATSLDIPINVKVNRPFMFFIRHRETGSFLFMGRVKEPNGNCPDMRNENLGGHSTASTPTSYTATLAIVPLLATKLAL